MHRELELVGGRSCLAFEVIGALRQPFKRKSGQRDLFVGAPFAALIETTDGHIRQYRKA